MDVGDEPDVRAANRCANIAEQLRGCLNGDVSSDDARTVVLHATNELLSLPAEFANGAQVHGLLDAASYLYSSADIERALICAKKSIDISRAKGLVPQLRRALSACGALLKEQGDVPAAIDMLLESLRVAKTLGSAGAEAPPWNNLGVLLQSCAQFEAALICFERARLAARDADDPQFYDSAVLALINIANCAVSLKKHTNRGLAAAREALARLDTLACQETEAAAPQVFNRVYAETQCARLLIEVGDFEGAAEHSRRATRFAARAPLERNIFLAEVAAGLVDVYASRIDQGLHKLGNAVDRARRTLPSHLHDALYASFEAYERIGDDERALKVLKEVLALAKDSQSARVHARLLVAIEAEDQQSNEELEAHLVGRAAKLQDRIAGRRLVLTNTAVEAALHCGRDARRPFRVARLAETFARHLGVPDEAALAIKYGGLLADIGMIAVSATIVHRQGALTKVQRQLLNKHAEHGASLIESSGVPLPAGVVELVRLHHERWNGSGPAGLVTDQIPLGARIIALADAFDAMTHPRIWPPKKTIQEAVWEIEGNDKAMFDQALAVLFAGFVRAEFWVHRDYEDYLGVEAGDNSFVRAQEDLVRLL